MLLLFILNKQKRIYVGVSSVCDLGVNGKETSVNQHLIYYQILRANSAIIQECLQKLYAEKNYFIIHVDFHDSEILS